MKNPISDGVKVNAGARYTTELILRDRFGKIKDHRVIHNTVEAAGKTSMANLFNASPTANKPTYMAVGTGTGGTTALTAEVSRPALTSKSNSGAVMTVQGDWAAGVATGALTEAGVFDASTAGVMWMYNSFSVINKGASDTLSIVWTLTIS